MSASFVERFHALADRHSPFCLGIDPSDEVLGGRSLEAFCADLTEQLIAAELAIVKPQSAYFERFGAAGWAVLERMIKRLRAAGILVLLDVKRGDIAATNQAYAQAFFDAAAPMRVDAITAHPYLGVGDLAPLFEAAEHASGLVFVVAASSNRGGRALQSARIGDHSLIDLLADEIAACDAAGAVIGAARDDVTPDLLARFGASLLLCPGIGAQGGGFDDLKRFPDPRLIIPTASRAVFHAADFAAALTQHKEAAFRLRAPLRS